MASTIRAAAFIFLLAAPLKAIATTVPVNYLLVCGHEFRLGAGRAASLDAALVGHCATVRVQTTTAPDDSVFILQAAGDPDTVYGDLTFKQGRLIRITKSWEIHIKSATQYADAFIDLLRRFEAEGNSACKIVTQQRREPDVGLNRATLLCGSKKIELSVTEYKGNKSFEISEVLE